MKSIVKILTVVGTGIAIGTVAGKLLSSDKIKNINLDKIKAKIQLPKLNESDVLVSSNKEELENCFI